MAPLHFSYSALVAPSGIKQQLPLPSESRFDDLDHYSHSMTQKTKSQRRSQHLTIFEDTTATAEKITERQDEVYSQEMEKVYQVTNKHTKYIGNKYACLVATWALPYARKFDELFPPPVLDLTIAMGLECFAHRRATAAVDFERQDNPERFDGFTASDVRELYHHILRLEFAYQRVKDTPNGKKIQWTSAEMPSEIVGVLAGYCMGKGCGLESPKVLIESTNASNVNQLYGPDYYSNLGKWWRFIAHFHTGEFWDRIGQGVTHVHDNNYQEWALHMSCRLKDSEEGNHRKEVLETILWPRWVKNPPWIIKEKREFGTLFPTRANRMEEEEEWSVHLGMENIPGQVWLEEHYSARFSQWLVENRDEPDLMWW